MNINVKVSPDIGKKPLRVVKINGGVTKNVDNFSVRYERNLRAGGTRDFHCYL